MTATTANTIQGTPPKFVTTGANKVDLTDFKYFGLRYNGTDYYSPTLLGAALDGAGAKNVTTKPSDLYGGTTLVYPLSLASLGTPSTAEIDDSDGDGTNPAPITESSAGSVTIDWYDDNTGNLLSLADKGKTFCALAAVGKAPYLKITGGIILNTTYGDPANQSYPDAAVGLNTIPSRKFYIPLSGGICSARANMTNSYGKYDPSNNTTPILGIFSGDSSSGAGDGLGFLPQVSGDNFPTTGADGLYFDLIIAGVDATHLDWPGYPTASPVVPALQDKGITVTVTNVEASKVTVKLNGPKVLKDVNNLPTVNTTTAFTGKPTNPASFVIKGNDNSGIVLSYAFNIKRWYVNRGRKAASGTAAGSSMPGGSTDNQTTWCNSLSGANYILPKVSDLTNAQGTTNNVHGGTATTVPIPNFTPSSTGNYHQRRIGGGLFSEWGYIEFYSGAVFYYGWPYYTSDFLGGYQFAVYANDANVAAMTSNYNAYVVCVSRP